MVAHCPLTSFLCLAAALLTAGAAEGNNHGCSDGWAPFGTRCFKFFDSKLNWTQAERNCQSHGANLASIHSAEENTFVVDLINKGAGENRPTLIGGQDGFQERLWMWTDGSVWDYSNWGQGEPNNKNRNENCAEINWPANTGSLWNDLAGNIPRDHICAKDASPKVSLTLGDVQYQCTPNMN